MLVHAKDWRSLAYLLGLPLLVIYQWNLSAFNPLLYAVTLLLVLGVCCINHNHAHVPMWRARSMNVLTDYWIGTLQGHPVFLFDVAHIASHHRYNQGEQDVTRLARWGVHNHIAGYLLFPVLAALPLARLKRDYIGRLLRGDVAQFAVVVLQHVPLLVLWVAAFMLDGSKAALYIVIPQVISLHFLLASNYLQHAHALAGSRYNHARNFTGAMNHFLFNVGYHTAHHEQENLHWSELPLAHARIQAHVDPALNERSLVVYFVRTLMLGAFIKRLRSRPLGPGDA
ncbi:MAG: fatty acid desaturase [Pseudomonadota bacterium]